MLKPMPVEETVIPERHVKLFKNGCNQAVRIPREFELPGDDAVIRKEGDRLIIEPTQPKSRIALLATLSPLDETFPPIPELPSIPSSIDEVSTRHQHRLRSRLQSAGASDPQLVLALGYSGSSKGRRSPHDAVAMFKVLILAEYITQTSISRIGLKQLLKPFPCEYEGYKNQEPKLLGESYDNGKETSSCSRHALLV